MQAASEKSDAAFFFCKNKLSDAAETFSIRMCF